LGLYFEEYIILDQINEAMKAKILPSINEHLDSQILLLEEMVNSFSSKWKIFIDIYFFQIKNSLVNKI